MNDSKHIQPTKKAIEEALKNPNGYVYIIDVAFENAKEIPPEAIKGAWKVSEKGEIIGDFIPNSNYKDFKNML